MVAKRNVKFARFGAQSRLILIQHFPSSFAETASLEEILAVARDRSEDGVVVCDSGDEDSSSSSSSDDNDQVHEEAADLLGPPPQMEAPTPAVNQVEPPAAPQPTLTGNALLETIRNLEDKDPIEDDVGSEEEDSGEDGFTFVKEQELKVVIQ